MFKVSIITASLNAEATISRHVESINSVSSPFVEHILVDGGSSDHTVQIFKSLSRKRTLIIQEPDNGIYDAWNKGLRVASGDFVLFLGSDDFLDPVSFDKVLLELNCCPDTILYGDVTMIFGDDTFFLDEGFFDERKLYRGFNFRTVTAFIPRIIFSRVGSFDTSYSIAGDTDWLLRAFKSGVRFEKACLRVNMGAYGVSNSNELKAYSEYLRALRAYGLLSYKCYWVWLKKCLKKYL